MPRLMSVAMTEDAVRARQKTVSRRLNWWADKNGRRLVPARRPAHAVPRR